MAGVLLRVDHVVGNVHVEVGRILMDAAMPLMPGITQGGGKAFLNGPEHLRRQLGFVLRAETDNKVVGFALSAAGVHGLNVHGLGNAASVVIVAKASGAPVHEALFAFMSGVGNVIGQTGVIVVFRADAHFLADHRMTAMACCTSRCRASSSCKRR